MKVEAHAAASPALMQWSYKPSLKTTKKSLSSGHGPGYAHGHNKPIKEFPTKVDTLYMEI